MRLREVIGLVGGLILWIPYSLYSGWSGVKAMASHDTSALNLEALVDRVDRINRPAASIPTFQHPQQHPQQQQQHCAIVISHLYGNHRDRRRMIALDWYRRVAVNSIRLAAEHSNMTAVMIVLNNTGGYANDLVDDTDADSLGSVVSFYRIGGSGRAPAGTSSSETTNSKVQRLATEQKCQFMSLMRLDADDMLLTTAFQNIEMGWRGVVSSNKCNVSSLDQHCPHALVSGIPLFEVPQYVLDPVASDGSMTCSVLPPIARFGRKHEFIVASAGLVVTMTHDLWMSRFAGESSLSSLAGEIRSDGDYHERVPEIMAKKLCLVNIKPHFQKLPSNHSIWIQTPLSGHYEPSVASSPIAHFKTSPNCSVRKAENCCGPIDCTFHGLL